MKAPIRIGLQPGVRVLYVERIPKTAYDPNTDRKFEVRNEHLNGYWLIPQSTNPDRTLGIFLKLYDTGKIERVTVRADQGDEVVLIKPEDGK